MPPTPQCSLWWFPGLPRPGPFLETPMHNLAPAISHDSLAGYLKNFEGLICPHCRAPVKRYIHHSHGGHWVPTWNCPKHGDVIAVEAKGFKS
jgi:hypothetical protein